MEWVTQEIVPDSGSAARYRYGAAVTSARTTAATLEYRVELLRTSATAPDEPRLAEGLATVPGGGTDTLGGQTVTLAAGDRVEARLQLRHVQEGWIKCDPLVRTFGTAAATTPAGPALATDPDFLEIDGLVIDRVLTKSGRDFYELFYRDWSAPLGARNFTLLVEETPFRGRQTAIAVSVDEQLVYRQLLQTRYDVLEEMAASAVAIATAVLLQRAEAERVGADGDYIEQF